MHRRQMQRCCTECIRNMHTNHRAADGEMHDLPKRRAMEAFKRHSVARLWNLLRGSPRPHPARNRRRRNLSMRGEVCGEKKKESEKALRMQCHGRVEGSRGA